MNRDLKRMAEDRETMAGRFSEFFGSDDEDVSEFQKESNKLVDLSRRNAELNREINKDPMQRFPQHVARITADGRNPFTFRRNAQGMGCKGITKFV